MSARELPAHACTIGIVIPALNEERSLPLVLAALRDVARAPLAFTPDGRPALLMSIIVVDNGSTDRTADVARAAGAIVVSEVRRGYGQACLTGLATLAQDPPEIVVFLDADHSDDPGRLPQLVAPIVEGSLDLVIGSRLLGECSPGALLPQARYGNLLCVWLIRLLYGFRYTDLGPFRAISRNSLDRLGMADAGFGWTAEMQVKALLAGLRVGEISVPYRRRIGTSKISGTISGTVRAGGRILWTIGSLRRWKPSS